MQRPGNRFLPSVAFDKSIEQIGAHDFAARVECIQRDRMFAGTDIRRDGSCEDRTSQLSDTNYKVADS
jgi:hypothetical protein